MEKDKANERSGHLMVSDYRRPRHRATLEELQVHCLPLRLGWALLILCLPINTIYLEIVWRYQAVINMNNLDLKSLKR